jgi:hypothetical protein
MPEYKLVVNEDGAIILNQESEAVNSDTAFTLLDLLHERYERPACVYVVHNAAMEAYKIGWTAQKIESRVSQIRYDVGGWQGVELEFTLPCSSVSEARQLEVQLHTRFKDKHLYGEWFKLTDEDVNYLQDLWVLSSEVQSYSLKTLLFLFGRLRTADPQKAKPQDHEKARFVIQEMRRELEEAARKWGIEDV